MTRLTSQIFILLSVTLTIAAPHLRPRLVRHPPTTLAYPIYLTPGFKNGAGDLSKNWERRRGKLLQQAGH